MSIFIDETDPLTSPMKPNGVSEFGMVESPPRWRT
jgi:hypothetical protein